MKYINIKHARNTIKYLSKIKFIKTHSGYVHFFHEIFVYLILPRRAVTLIKIYDSYGTHTELTGRSYIIFVTRGVMKRNIFALYMCR